MPVIETQTERLVLRQWRGSDLAAFAALNADAEVMRYFPSTLSTTESNAMAARCQSLIAERGWGFWAVETRGSRDMVGFVGLHTPKPELPCAPCVEIGWRLAKPYWRRGYATEAARAALSVGFGALELNEIVAFTTLSNHPSRGVMKKLGMRYSEVFEHPDLPPGHPLRTHCLYRLSAEAFDD